MSRSCGTGGRCRPPVTGPIAALAAAFVLFAAGRTGAQESEAESMPAFLASMNWVHGPGTSGLGPEAEISIEKGYHATGGAGARKFLEATENIPSGQEVGLITPDSFQWFVVFSFEDCGYVKDEDKDDLDADKMLEALKASNAEGNKERRRRGLKALDLVGWEIEPRYDPETNNLEWGLRYKSSEGDVINFNTRRLGRRGVMNIELVVDPGALTQTLPVFKSLLQGFAFRSGKKYAEYTKGDKIAKYTLTGLVTGGALAVAAKTGLLSKAWKFLVFVFIAILAFIKKIFTAIKRKLSGEGGGASPYAGPTDGGVGGGGTAT